MAWALDVVIGKYQVVEDLKDSDESERATLFLCAYFSGTTKYLFKQKPMCQWYITGKKNMLKKKNRIVLVLALTVFGTLILSACDTLRDPAFQEGFRRGWNTTAPAQYRY